MKSILIIENDPGTMELLASIVENIGLNAVCIGEAVDIKTVETMNPALVLLDHWLDGMYGGDFCREIKSNPLTNHIPVMIISADPNSGLIAEVSGANDFVNKPFDLAELEQKIRGFTDVA